MLDYESRQIAARKGVHVTRIVILAILVSFALAYLLRVISKPIYPRVNDSRLKCLNNLRQIGMGLELYASNNNGQFPRGLYNPRAADKPVAFTHASDNAAKIFTGANAPTNDVTVPILMLLQTGDLTPGVFVCPLSNADAWQITTEGAAGFSNIPSADHLSYSILNPYLKSDDPAARNKWWMQNTNPKHPTVIAADLNPGTPDLLKLTPQSTHAQMKKGNSPNHDGAGQNVLFSDGHAEWLTTPFYAIASSSTTQRSSPQPSPTDDNIYTYGTGDKQGIIGSSTDGDDAVLLPTEQKK